MIEKNRIKLHFFNRTQVSSYKETFGYVNGVTNNKHIYYTVKDVNYKSDFDRSYYGEIDNEKYSLKYDSLNPENVVINYTKPIFTNDEKTSFCKGVILKITNYKWPFGNAYGISYQYKHSGIVFEREQDISYVDYLKLKVGKNIKVEYWVQNPQRAVASFKKK